MSEWVYLSYPLKEQTPLYGNSGKIKLKRARQIQNGDRSNNTELHFPAHSGHTWMLKIILMTMEKVWMNTLLATGFLITLGSLLYR